jgi:hypothetical protein
MRAPQVFDIIPISKTETTDEEHHMYTATVVSYDKGDKWGWLQIKNGPRFRLWPENGRAVGVINDRVDLGPKLVRHGPDTLVPETGGELVCRVASVKGRKVLLWASRAQLERAHEAVRMGEPVLAFLST